MIFLTYNDNYSGIYQSQVIDVCSYLEKEFALKVKLVAFVSIRNISTQKKLITSNYANSIVLPMFPKVKFWKWNAITLLFTCLFINEKHIWARGAFAANLSIYLKKLNIIKKVLFDARGAYQAELTEYNVVADKTIVQEIETIEKNALEKSDEQLAVSNQLVDWWNSKYKFSPKNNIVIPCTLSSFFYDSFCNENEWFNKRTSEGFSKDDMIVVYSGSSAGWQSFDLVDDYLYNLFLSTEKMKLIFLSNKLPEKSKTFEKFANKITTKWVKPNEVKHLMLLADYGILVREKSVTNQVASPVKFAEYLACGLQVLISEGIGDFSDFVKQHKCGVIFSDVTKLENVSFSQKVKNNQLALQYFLKESKENKLAYKKAVDLLA